MCRYAMHSYKPHYACFKCRKAFKRRLMGNTYKVDPAPVAAKCPQCGELMANMGLDFESPKQNDIKAWQHIQSLYSVGITFHSCGCSGPGYIPKNTEALIQYLEDILKDYLENLKFWRQRIVPTNKREMERENSKFWNFISKMPGQLRPQKAPVNTEDAINYWIGRVKEVQLNLEKIQV